MTPASWMFVSNMMLVSLIMSGIRGSPADITTVCVLTNGVVGIFLVSAWLVFKGTAK